VLVLFLLKKEEGRVVVQAAFMTFEL